MILPVHRLERDTCFSQLENYKNYRFWECKTIGRMLHKGHFVYYQIAEKHISSCLKFMRGIGKTASRPPFLNTHTHPFLTGWISPILIKTAFGSMTERLWHSAFMKIR